VSLERSRHGRWRWYAPLNREGDGNAMQALGAIGDVMGINHTGWLRWLI